MNSLKNIFVLLICVCFLIHKAYSQENLALIDCSRTIGTIKGLHGVNLGPLCYRGTIDLSSYHKELKVPYTRLHDVVWINADAVDISTIFRDFRDDPENAENYDFKTTDDYIQAIVNVGSKIVYRLGESIEHTPRKYRVHPPQDYEKWAKICLGIIRHYNQGWANGFHHNIQYWEIWNEPDVKPSMWTGTDNQYFELYKVTAQLIKKQFPDLKVGGPAVGNPVVFEGGSSKPSDFAYKFLDYCKENKVPLDFFSWHCYTDNPSVIVRKAKAVRSILNEYGFQSTESHLNEWNYLPNNDWRPMLKNGQGIMREKWYEKMGGTAGSSFLVSVLSLLQDSQVDVANFYTGEIQGFGLFNYYGAPKKNYYGMKAFSLMLGTPTRIQATLPIPQSTILAGVNENRDRVNVLIALNSKTKQQLKIQINNIFWNQQTDCNILAVNSDKNLEPISNTLLQPPNNLIKITCEPPTVLLLELQPAKK